MSDPTPTPTPREVLDAVLASPNGRAIAAMYGPEFTGRTLPTLVSEILAALAATGDAPLTEKRLAELTGIFESSKSIIDETCGFELITAYRTLAAQCAAARAERDALRERVRRITEPYMALLLDRDSRKWIAPQIWFAIEQAVKATPARPTDTGRDG